MTLALVLVLLLWLITMPYGVAAVALIDVAIVAYSTHEQRKAAEEAKNEAAQAAKLLEPPKQPLGAMESAAAQVQRADLLSQSAGNTVLSDNKNRGGVGTAVKPPATLLGTG